MPKPGSLTERTTMPTDDACATCRVNIHNAIEKVRDCASAKVPKWLFGLLVGVIMSVAAGLCAFGLSNASMANENRTLVMIEQVKGTASDEKLERIITTQEKMAETQQEILRRLPE